MRLGSWLDIKGGLFYPLRRTQVCRIILTMTSLSQRWPRGVFLCPNTVILECFSRGSSLRGNDGFKGENMNLEELGIPFTQIGKNKEIDLFYHISKSLVSKSYLNEILQLIVTMTASVMQSKICSLMLLDEEKQELTIAATQALSPGYLNKPNVKVGESVSGRAVIEKTPVTVLDVSLEKTYMFPDVAKKEGIVSMLSVPMFIDGRVIGVINSYTTERHEFTSSEVRMIQVVANQAAVAIENTKLRQENLENKQALEERKVVDRAKSLLMEKDGLKENEAYKLLQKTSRDHRKSMAEVANAILLAYSLRK